MSKRVIRDSDIREAARELLKREAKDFLEDSSASLAWHYSESELESSQIKAWNKIQAEMQLREKDGKRSGASSILRGSGKRPSLAAAALAVVLFSTAAISAGAREMIVSFIRNINGDNADYEFYGDTETDGAAVSLPSLNANELFDEFELIEQSNHSKYRREYYVDISSGNIIEYICFTTDSSASVGFTGGVDARKTVNVHGFEGDLYPAGESSEQSNLTWIDNDDEIVYVITSTLDTDSIFELADFIYKKK